jgi:hypothetical protein
MKIKDLPYFPDSIMKVKEIARKIGSAVHAKPRLERVARRRPFHPLGTRLVPVACGFENVETRDRRSSICASRADTRLWADPNLAGLAHGERSRAISCKSMKSR